MKEKEQKMHLNLKDLHIWLLVKHETFQKMFHVMN